MTQKDFFSHSTAHLGLKLQYNALRHQTRRE